MLANPSFPVSRIQWIAWLRSKTGDSVSRITRRERQQCNLQNNRGQGMNNKYQPLDSCLPKVVKQNYAIRNGIHKQNLHAAVAVYVDCTEDHSLEGLEYELWLRNRTALYGVENLVLATGYCETADVGGR